MSCRFLKMASAFGLRLDKVLEIPFQVKIFVQLIRTFEMWCSRGMEKKLGPSNEKSRSITKSQCEREYCACNNTKRD